MSGCDCEPIREDFGFGFNDSNFSDRILRIEIVAGDDEAVNSGNSHCSHDGSSPLFRVKTLHINSLILAAKSPFFFKLFSNGMMESEQRDVTMRIKDSDEDALMELLRFMYINALTSKTYPLLLDVLRVADKFEVTSCMTHCIRALTNLPMTAESALLYLSLPSSLLMADAVKQLTADIKHFLVYCYRDILKFEDELINFPLVGVEAILSSDSLEVTSEDEVYDFALKWTRVHYQKPEEQREILSTHLGPNIRFSCMTFRKLGKILADKDFDHDFATKFVLDALLCKAESRDHPQNRRFVKRAYTYRPIRIVEFEQLHLHKQYVVYLNLEKKDCAKMLPWSRVDFQAFDMGGQGFKLYAQRDSNFLGLYLERSHDASATFDVEFEYSARSKPTEKYVSKCNGNYTYTNGKVFGYSNLLGIPWSSFMAEDCIYFINGALHLRAEFTIKC